MSARRFPAMLMVGLMTLAAGPAVAADDRAPLWMPQPESAVEVAVAVEHAVSMARYRQAMQEGRREAHVAFPVSTRWLWMAPEGGSVQRVANNTFRITDKSCLTAFCQLLDCIVGTWPQLFCHDGEQRKIAAPDLETVVLDNRVFKRSMPSAPVAAVPAEGEQEPVEADQNTAR